MGTTERRSKLHAALLLLLTLVTGIVIGVAADRLLLFGQHRLFPKHGVRVMTRHIAERLDRDLDLTPEQRKTIDQILERHRVKIEAAWDDIRPAMHRELDMTQREIEAVLRPEQKPEFRKIARRWQQRHGAR